ncbi:MAG: preprotein translocase subunit SecA [Clostridia bacterium]|nr:preprotein translocase subunit SecA [Clostridia bacterium]
MGLFSKIFGDYSEKEVKKIKHYVTEINELEPSMEKLTDGELKNKTEEFKERLKNGETLDDILVEAFAVVREASKRVFGKRPFDVQLIGGIILHQGRIAEMKTGEGKTLTATLPLYLNALEGKGAYLVTVNDYLAKSQGEEMGKLYNFLGLSLGIIVHDINGAEKKAAYDADITYGTNNEFGFDYLRDNMAIQKNQVVQRQLHYAIVDEIDSILIDEARTPLIISGQADKANDLYKTADRFVKKLKVKVIAKSDDKKLEDEEDRKYDYIVDEKAHTAALTETGTKKAEREFGVENLSDIENMTLLHHINQALRANGVMHRDKDYIVKDGEVLIVDEHTGRIMYGRRYSEGLHQAIEAKENVQIANESKTLATITFQNYFRMFDKLAGMTGTAMTEENEFREIYGLDVVAIPTNMPMIRVDHNDIIYKTERAKLRAVVEDIKQSHAKGQPVLVGTITVDKSEYLSGLLKREGIKHEVLNAKYHAKEAEIVAQAGRYGAVTIATNMAGRGTDILLGGNTEALAKQELRRQGVSEEDIMNAVSLNETTDEKILMLRDHYRHIYEKLDEDVKAEKEKVIAAGGLKIIGTERHESRRIDNQLRGRSGRQGDIGESRFYISFEDDLMRLFGAEKMQNIVSALQIPEDMPLEAKMMTGTIETAQKSVESRNFSIRKHVLQFDDVMNMQREKIYNERNQVLDGTDMRETVLKMLANSVDNIVDMHVSPETTEIEKEEFEKYVQKIFGIEYKVETKNNEKVREDVKKLAEEKYKEKEEELGAEELRKYERYVILKTVDAKWMDHIDAMDQLKQGVNLRAYGQRDPVTEFKYESYDMFNEMTASIEEEVIRTILHSRKVQEQENKLPDIMKKLMTNLEAAKAATTEKSQPKVNKGEKVGRNDPCPCGSGKKYKKCCGANE